MARPPIPDDERRDETIKLRVTAAELADIERVREALGLAEERERSEALRALPRIYDERTLLVRAALEPLRGRLTNADVILVLDVANGLHDLREHAGGPAGADLLACVADAGKRDGADPRRIMREVAKAGPAARPALAYWAEMLWRRHEDDDLWEREQEWLATRPE